MGPVNARVAHDPHAVRGRDRREQHRAAERNRRRDMVRVVLRQRPEYARRCAIHEAGHATAFAMCGVATVRVWLDVRPGDRLDGWAQPSTADVPAWTLLAGTASEWLMCYPNAVPHIRRNEVDLQLARERLEEGQTLWTEFARAKNELLPHEEILKRIAAALVAEGELEADELRPLLADVPRVSHAPGQSAVLSTGSGMSWGGGGVKSLALAAPGPAGSHRRMSISPVRQDTGGDK